MDLAKREKIANLLEINLWSAGDALDKGEKVKDTELPSFIKCCRSAFHRANQNLSANAIFNATKPVITSVVICVTTL